MIRRIGILGAGAWGTALAVIAERAGREVILWPRRRPQAEALAAERENRLHLPGVRLAPAIHVSAEQAPVFESDAVLVALPAQHLREHLAGLSWPRHIPAVICAKGIERGSLKSMPELLAELQPDADAAVL